RTARARASRPRRRARRGGARTAGGSGRRRRGAPRAADGPRSSTGTCRCGSARTCDSRSPRSAAIHCAPARGSGTRSGFDGPWRKHLPLGRAALGGRWRPSGAGDTCAPTASGSPRVQGRAPPGFRSGRPGAGPRRPRTPARSIDRLPRWERARKSIGRAARKTAPSRLPEVLVEGDALKRVLLFVATNIAILLVLSITLRLVGFQGFLADNGVDLALPQLLLFAAVFGMGGSFVSLAMSKWIAKRATGAQVIQTPRSAGEQWLVETVRQQAKA